MTLDQFVPSLSKPAPPPGLSAPLRALWYAARDDWNRAHRLVQDENSNEAAWVHAYLHRVEGDFSNAGYWYKRAQREVSKQSLQEEWRTIAESLLAQI